MHDEVSETENIRKNLAIERMIVEGCDILLDVNQVFVRQGSLIQIPSEKPKGQWNRISSFKSEKESVRQCFLFSNHMLLTTRSSGGRLHLVPGCGKISIADTILVEDPSECYIVDDDGESSSGSMSSQSSEGGQQFVAYGGSSSGGGFRHNHHHNHDFKLIVDVKGGSPITVHLAASTEQEKTAWISDISHCMDNVHFNDLFHNANEDTSSVTMPNSIRNDPRLFKDDVDIRFSRTLNSCKLPLIRYATPKRLLDRLTDLRFLSIDFLNTFMLTYRVFTDGLTVLEALKKVYYNPDVPYFPEDGTIEVTYGHHAADGGRLSVSSVMSWESDGNYRRVSSASCNSETTYEREREHSIGHASHVSTGSYGSHWKYTHRKCKRYEEEQWRTPRDSLAPPSSGIFHTNTTTTITNAASNATSSLFNVPTIPAVPSAAATMASLTSAPVDSNTSTASSSSAAVNDTLSQSLPEEGKHLQVPTTLASSQSSETLTEPAVSAPSSPSSITTTSTSTHTLVPSGDDDTEGTGKPVETPAVQPPTITVPIPLPLISKPQEPPPSPRTRSMMPSFLSSPLLGKKLKDSDQKHDKKDFKSTKDNIKDKVKEMFSSPLSSSATGLKTPTVVRISAPVNTDDQNQSTTDSPLLERHRKSTTSIASAPAFSLNGSHLYSKRASSASSKRGSGADTGDGSFYTPRGSFLSSIDSPQHSSKAGVVVTSSRPSQRRSSTSSAAAAFAVATAGCSNPRDQLSPPQRTARFLSAGTTDARFSPAKRDSMMNSAATMRVLKVLRHWISKHSRDFENGPELTRATADFLEEVVNNVNLLPAEHKAAAQLFQMVTHMEPDINKVDLDLLLAAPSTPSKENIETLSALEIAEQMTFLDHKIFINIRSEEFLGQAWMKPDKATKTPNILLITKRFNDVSRLVVSEIIRRTNLASRIAAIEKWAAVADICRCLHNFNGVLQICAAFVNSSVFRLKKTWEKLSKTTKQTVEKLQTLVSSDCRFRNLREALHSRCDPPCIPYLGMYLTDLSFIEEGTPNFTEDGLLNFSKMRMIAHVIREILVFQTTPYKIELSQKVANYLLDPSLLLPDEELYRMSLAIEPRQSRLSTTTLQGTNPG
ncbi:hypothetical protein CHUAL_000631 [Chamberlinius hualienensis]